MALLLLAFSVVQGVGFVESMSASGHHANEAYTVSYALEIWLPRVFYPLIALCVVAQSLAQSGRNFIQRSNLFTIPVVAVLIEAAIQVSTEKVSPGIFAAIFFVVWINQWMPALSGEHEDWFDRYVFPALLIYLITPIFFLFALHLANMLDVLPEKFQFIIDRASNDGLFRGESFRGFGRDRIAYSYLCGMALLYLLAARGLGVKVLACMMFLVFALVMSGARAVLLALVVAVCFMLRLKRIGLFSLAGGGAVIFAAAFISGRPGFFGDPGGRISILSAYMAHLSANPLLLLTGEGYFGAGFLLGDGTLVRPHSWPLNSIINFGVLITAAWMVFLCRFFKKLNTAGRAVWIYFVTLGFFHNGFDAYLFSLEQLLAFSLAMTLSVKKSQPFSLGNKGGGSSHAP